MNVWQDQDEMFYVKRKLKRISGATIFVNFYTGRFFHLDARNEDQTEDNLIFSEDLGEDCQSRG
jgi:hypothetical protein